MPSLSIVMPSVIIIFSPFFIITSPLGFTLQLSVHIISWSIKTHLPPFITIIFPSFIVIVPSATVDIIEDDVELIESELIFLSVIEESAVDSVFEEPLLQEVTKAAMATIAINFFIRFYFKVLKFNRFKV